MAKKMAKKVVARKQVKASRTPARRARADALLPIQPTLLTPKLPVEVLERAVDAVLVNKA